MVELAAVLGVAIVLFVSTNIASRCLPIQPSSRARSCSVTPIVLMLVGALIVIDSGAYQLLTR